MGSWSSSSAKLDTGQGARGGKACVEETHIQRQVTCLDGESGMDRWQIGDWHWSAPKVLVRNIQMWLLSNVTAVPSQQPLRIPSSPLLCGAEPQLFSSSSVRIPTQSSLHVTKMWDRDMNMRPLWILQSTGSSTAYAPAHCLLRDHGNSWYLQRAFECLSKYRRKCLYRHNLISKTVTIMKLGRKGDSLCVFMRERK